MNIIGITGKSGSGKTTFATLIAEKLQCKHIDVDKIGHQALQQPEIINKLCDKFGMGIFDEQGNLDRKKIGDVVFSQKDKMKELEDFTWEYMRNTIDEMIETKEKIIILEWILLPQSKYWDSCDTKVLVTSNDAERKSKVLERDNISNEYFNKRESASIDYSNFKFDYILKNDYKLGTMDEIIEKIIERYKGEKI